MGWQAEVDQRERIATQKELALGATQKERGAAAEKEGRRQAELARRERQIAGAMLGKMSRTDLQYHGIPW